MAEQTTNGKLHGGEWYDIPLLYYKGPSWASEPPVWPVVTFKCIGHHARHKKVAKWIVDCISPDQPLPAMKVSERMELYLLLEQRLKEVTGLPVTAGLLLATRMEKGLDGKGAFWRSMPELGEGVTTYAEEDRKGVVRKAHHEREQKPPILSLSKEGSHG